MEALRTVSSASLVWTVSLLLKRISRLQFAKVDQNNNAILYNEAEKELKAMIAYRSSLRQAEKVLSAELTISIIFKLNHIQFGFCFFC